MEKIYLQIMIAQASIEILFNAYSRHQDFKLSDEDIIDFCDLFDSHLTQIQNTIIEKKLVPEPCIQSLKYVQNMDKICANS